MTIASSEVNDLRNLSARLGRDPMLVQAASGNTSIKIGSKLWIKGSGKWLSDARHAEIFVPVDVRTLEADSSPLAPSIETAMHAVLPHRVVVHVHSVNAISWAVRLDGRERAAERLAGLHWAWIPYVPSGQPLADEIQLARLRARNTSPDVFLLGNHGLVIAAHDCEGAESLLAEVERRLEVAPRAAPAPDRALLSSMACGTVYHVPAEPEVHWLGTDAISRSILAQGTIFPCQALFLGPATAECDPFDSVITAADKYERRYGSRPSTIAVSGEGLLITNEMSVTQMQILRGLAQVIQRIDQDAPIRFLTQQETAELLNTDSYRYRENAEARAVVAAH